jgi:hypothetical protein
MKKISLYILTIIAFAAGSCKKQQLTNPSPLLSSFTIVNTVTDAGPFYVDPYAGQSNFSKQKDSLNYQSRREYGMPNGALSLKIVSYRDTTQQFFKGQFNLLPGKAYSFYVTGYGSKKDTLYKPESNFPHYTDSAVAVRVINLAIGGPVVNVTLSSGTGTNEFTNIGYKAVTAFKKYTLTNAVVNNGSLTFNINDDSGNVLASYNLPQYDYNYPPLPTTGTARFKALTLIICGDINAAPYTQNAYTVFAIANY